MLLLWLLKTLHFSPCLEGKRKISLLFLRYYFSLYDFIINSFSFLMNCKTSLSFTPLSSLFFHHSIKNILWKQSEVIYCTPFCYLIFNEIKIIYLMRKLIKNYCWEETCGTFGKKAMKIEEIKYTV